MSGCSSDGRTNLDEKVTSKEISMRGKRKCYERAASTDKPYRTERKEQKILYAFTCCWETDVELTDLFR